MRYKRHEVPLGLGNIYLQVYQLFNKDLFALHEIAEQKYDHQFQVGMDSSTEFHKKFYDKYREGWVNLELAYYGLIHAYIAPLFNEDFLYQKFPTVRFHLPNHVAVGAFHKDKDFNHPKGEINFIIPLTDSDDTASVWVESEPDKGDFEPMIMRIGEIIEFNGNQLTHGNKINETNRTRVSMDFRILPISCYDENNSGLSVTQSTKFKEGEYYKLYKKHR